MYGGVTGKAGDRLPMSIVGRAMTLRVPCAVHRHRQRATDPMARVSPGTNHAHRREQSLPIRLLQAIQSLGGLGFRGNIQPHGRKKGDVGVIAGYMLGAAKIKIRVEDAEMLRQ